ncbi:hypothetical protein M7I_4011 [Glarea lozoyensis 74030]|uniref:2EXR domain-containing protein n=1 Tax=Glarea lozoyensis (strain ATCC 74030 / MF5533) TaxID=1104152 RepID=H0EN12_GLAL7|nr:hypothetical protein M7I_4011 [Glarea lozoyensis 74030]
MEPVTSFNLFPKLPAELRIKIWLLVCPTHQRIVHIREKLTELGDMRDVGYWPDKASDCDSLDLAVQEDTYCPYIDEALPVKYGNDYHIWTGHGQAQLADYGFTSSVPQPEKPTKEKIKQDWITKWENTRGSGIWSPNAIPVALHVCRETRSLYQRFGYALAFKTRTQPAMTWYNHSKDILYLPPNYVGEIQEVFEIGSGLYPEDLKGVVGQLSSDDLELVKKIAVPLDFLVSYPGNLPARRANEFVSWWIPLLRRFKTLQELVIITDGNRDPPRHLHVSQVEKFERKDIYWGDGNPCDCMVIDTALEDNWGHYIGWLPKWKPRNGISYDIRTYEQYYPSEMNDCYEKIARRYQANIDDTGWSTSEPGTINNNISPRIPKVRIANIISSTSTQEVQESRKRYRQAALPTEEIEDELFTDEWVEEVHAQREAKHGVKAAWMDVEAPYFRHGVD